MSLDFITDAFNKLSSLNEEVFDASSLDTDELRAVLDAEKTFDVIDTDLENNEDANPISYIGKIILSCNACSSLVFVDKDEIKIDDNDVNADMICPYCQNENGYTIVGKVCPFADADMDTEDTLVDEATKVKWDSNNAATLTESAEKPVIPAPFDKYYVVADYEPEEGEYQLGDQIEGTDAHILAYIDVKPEFEDIVVAPEAFLVDDKDFPVVYVAGGRMYPVEVPEEESLTEDINTISVETDDSHVDVEDNAGSVQITVAPLTDAEKEEILNQSNEDASVEENSENAPVTETPAEDVPVENEIDIDVDEVEEESFNNLTSRYLTRIYENVEGFEATKIQATDTKLFVEGVVSFKSGNKKATTFIFESKDASANGTCRFVGANKHFSRGNKAFTLTGSVKDGKFLSEKLQYNYRTKDSDGKSLSLYGTVTCKD